MIFTKIILDKKGILDKKLITMILVILVVAVTISFLFKGNAFAFLENFLPDLGVGDDDNDVVIGGDNEIIVEGEVSEAQLAKLMKGETTCSCGDNCENYAKLITQYSEENGVNSVLVLALIIQESKCKKDASSGSSYGLMQINAGVWCNSFKELNNDVEKCKEQLLNNEELNIDVGVKILKKYYNDYGLDLVRQTYVSKVKKYCTSSYQEKYLSYTGWDSALRAYNGFGCEEKSADVNYVEKINALYTKLNQELNEK